MYLMLKPGSLSDPSLDDTKEEEAEPTVIRYTIVSNGAFVWRYPSIEWGWNTASRIITISVSLKFLALQAC